MKNNKWIISIFTIFVLVFVSCKESLLQSYDTTLKTGTLSISVHSSSARNILPDTSAEGFTDFVLTGSTDGGQTYSPLGSWDTLDKLKAAIIEMNLGTWQLSLSAKKGEVPFTASTQVTIEEGQNVKASFSLSAANSQKGMANITLRYPKTYSMGIVFWNISEISENSDSPFLESLNEVASGSCHRNTTFNEGDADQQITDTAFTLKTELPAGKYMLRCYFGTQSGEPVAIPGGGFTGYTLIGDYIDYLVIQSGLESKLDYTIDYFELLGITNAVSTAQGIELSIQVPKGIKDILIQRATNFNEVMTNPTEENMANNVMSFIKILETPTTSSTTMTFVDSYGYTAGQKQTYIVLYNYFSENTIQNYYMKEVTPAYNGYAVPGFSTYPEFATESNAEGKTTKIKIVNEPVIDWKGHVLNSEYTIFVSEDYEAAIMGEPDYVFTKDDKECSVNPNRLHSGPNLLPGYTLLFEKDGWYYNCAIDKTGLTGNQLPVLQGRPYAIPTDRGIDIEVYCDWQGEIAENGGEKVNLFRSTNPDSGYETIKDLADASGQNFIYVDRKNLQKDVTYYYKLVGESGTVYGDPSFSATSSVNYGIPLTITTNPKLEVSANSVATFTPGTYQLDEHLARYDICYDFKQSDNNNKMIRIIKENYISNGEWVAPDLRAMIWEYDEDGTVHGFDPFDHSTQTNSKNLYYEPLDGKQYVFDKAYIECYDSYSGYGSLIDVINFTPSAQEYPSSFVIHTDVILLSGDHSSNGITLNIRNIPQEADSILVKRYSESDYTEYELFRVNNLSSASISLLDSYVNPNNNYYYYTIYAYKGDTSLDYATTQAHGFSSYGKGLGEIGLTVSTADNTVFLQFSIPDGTSNPVIYREGPSEVIITPASGKYAITDYFVQAGWYYNYSLAISIDYDGSGSIIYTPRSEKKSVDFSGYTEDFYNCPEITKVPEYTWNYDEANNFTMTFTGAPEVFKDNELPEFTVSKLDLKFKYDDMHKVTIPYTGSNTLTYKLVSPGSFTYELQPVSYGIFTCDDYTYEGDAVISYDLLYTGEDTEKYWLKELPGYIKVN